MIESFKRNWWVWAIHGLILVAFGFAAAAIFTFPWKILSVVALGYVVSLPISFMSYRRSARQLTEG